MWSILAVEQERPDQYELPERTPHACNEYFCISWQRRRRGQVQSEWWTLRASCFYFPRHSSHFSNLQPAERKEPPSSPLNLHWNKDWRWNGSPGFLHRFWFLLFCLIRCLLSSDCLTVQQPSGKSLYFLFWDVCTHYIQTVSASCFFFFFFNCHYYNCFNIRLHYTVSGVSVILCTQCVF